MTDWLPAVQAIPRTLLILGLYVVFSPAVLLGLVARLCWEFAVIGWESVEAVL